MHIPNYVQTVMRMFPKSYINRNFELVLAPTTQAVVILDGCKSSVDVKVAILEQFSKECAFSSKSRYAHVNTRYINDNRFNLNDLFETKFTVEDMRLIYFKLGNGVDRKLAIKFVESGFDMELLKGEE